MCLKKSSYNDNCLPMKWCFTNVYKPIHPIAMIVAKVSCHFLSKCLIHAFCSDDSNRLMRSNFIY